MNNTINELMQRIGEVIHKNPQDLTSEDLDDCILAARRWFAMYEKGEKPTQELPKIDLVKIGLAKPLEIKRRKGL